MSKIQRALISVSDKTGVIDFARQLADQGVEILSTGGTGIRAVDQCFAFFAFPGRFVGVVPVALGVFSFINHRFIQVVNCAIQYLG